MAELARQGDLNGLIDGAGEILASGLRLDSIDSIDAIDAWDYQSVEQPLTDFQTNAWQPALPGDTTANGNGFNTEWLGDDGAAFDIATGGLSGEPWTTLPTELSSDPRQAFPPEVTLNPGRSVASGGLSSPIEPVVVTPEPATLVLLGLGLIGIAGRRCARAATADRG